MPLADPWGVYADTSGNVFITDRNSFRILKVDTSGIMSIIAGTGSSAYYTGADGVAGSTCAVDYSNGIYGDTAANIYFAERDACRIRKLTVSTYILSTAAGVVAGNSCGNTADGNTILGSSIYYPMGLFIDTAAVMYYSEYAGYCRVRKFSLSTGIVSTIAGTTSCTAGAVNGPATSISLYNPFQIWADPSSGAVYIAEYAAYRVRKVLGGIITTYAGSGTCCGNTITEGASATSMNFNVVNGVFGDTTGNIYVSYAGGARILRVNSAGLIYTYAGNGVSGTTDNIAATSGALYDPCGIFIDTQGSLYFADWSGYKVRKISANSPSSTPTGNRIIALDSFQYFLQPAIRYIIHSIYFITHFHFYNIYPYFSNFEMSEMITIIILIFI
jgi:hypothetical protein